MRTLLLLSALLFTACGGGGSIDTINNSEADTAITCHESPATGILRKKVGKSNIAFQNFNNEQTILVENIEENTIPSIAGTSYNSSLLYNLLHSSYYWASETREENNLNQYASPQTMINDLAYTKDRWSFAISPSSYNQLISQKSEGLGFACTSVTKGCHITRVRLDSPADKVGLQRGDIILTLNGLAGTWENVILLAQQRKPIAFKIERENQIIQVCSCKVTPREYSYKVIKTKIVKSPNNTTVGYLQFDSFMGGDEIINQLNQAFQEFKDASINKLVIDLRYNGGGAVSIASELLNKLTTSHTSDLQFTLAWNSDYASNNHPYNFQNDPHAIELEQILFLTTANSASASELVINAMKPYLAAEDVVTIGDKTHGKPVGMSGIAGNYYYYFLINFVVKNSLGFYDYFQGLPVTSGCDIEDDFFHVRGDVNESMLKAALTYIDIGSCQ